MPPQTPVSSASTKRPSEKDLKVIKSSVEKQNTFISVVKSSKKFSEKEKDALQINTVEGFHNIWESTLEAQRDFEASHETGCGLWSRRYQNAGKVFKDFMTNFSAILNIIKGFGQPYSEVAVSIISLLFAVAVYKDEIESAFAEVLTEITDRLAGLRLYQLIYTDKHELDEMLQDRILSAYQKFMEFCIETTKYYKGTGMLRWFKVFTRSSTLRDRAKEVLDVMSQIGKLSNELSHKDVHMIKQQQEESLAMLERLQKELSSRADNRVLSDIRDSLSLRGYSSDAQRKEREQYQQHLASEEHLNAEFFEQMQGTRLEEFKNCQDYQTWNTCSSSCLLIISGHNDESITYLDYSWASPVALTLIAELDQTHDTTVYSYYIFPSMNSSLYYAMSTILLQLLSQRPRLLQNEALHTQLRDSISHFSDSEAAAKAKSNSWKQQAVRLLEAFEDVVLRVLDFFGPSETVYIILDRVHQCGELTTKPDHRRSLIQLLVKIVEADKYKVKVLVVINGDHWNVRSSIGDKLDEATPGRVILHRAQQRRIDQVN